MFGSTLTSGVSFSFTMLKICVLSPRSRFWVNPSTFVGTMIVHASDLCIFKFLVLKVMFGILATCRNSVTMKFAIDAVVSSAFNNDGLLVAFIF